MEFPPARMAVELRAPAQGLLVGSGDDVRKPLTVAQIAARTGLEVMEIGGYLELIAADGALDRFAAPRTPAPAVRSEGSRWRSLAGRIGRALGFS
jgi:hypothetical protein